MQHSIFKDIYNVFEERRLELLVRKTRTDEVQCPMPHNAIQTTKHCSLTWQSDP